MATQKDVQDLLRLLTTGRNKIPMLAAMARVKELHAANLTSVAAIAGADLNALKVAIPDEKVAKALLAACKTSVKAPATPSTTGAKRNAAGNLDSPDGKKLKSVFSLPDEPSTPAQLEKSLELPQPCLDVDELSRTVLFTNRAPLVLAFAVVLLKYTMPEQPLSGRLSLAQGVCAANSRSKAVSLGLEKGSAEGEGWGSGQPKVKIMGREVCVLKRSGYTWREEGETQTQGHQVDDNAQESQSSTATLQDQPKKIDGWTVSAPVTSKKSTFIARSLNVSSPTEAKSAVQKLLASTLELRDASHNITAYRVRGSYGLIEDSNDDGEAGGGRHVLGVLKDSNALDILLVVSRWWGGIMLGPDRWRIMTQVSRDALSQRLQVIGSVGQEALWALDLEAMKASNSGPTGSAMPVHRPEGARAYIMKAFPSPEEKSDGDVKKLKKKTVAQAQAEKEDNLGRLIGALELLFESWVDAIGREELDRRAWSWYVAVRPEVQSGVGGWGGKGEVKLEEILKLRRKTNDE